jgi:hypothetical protein
MVSVSLTFESLKNVAKNHFWIMECFLVNYTFFLISPWWLTQNPSKLVTLVKRVSTRGLLEGLSYHSSLTLTSFNTSSPLFPHILGFQLHCPQEGIVPHFMGRRD